MPCVNRARDYSRMTAFLAASSSLNSSKWGMRCTAWWCGTCVERADTSGAIGYEKALDMGIQHSHSSTFSRPGRGWAVTTGRFVPQNDKCTKSARETRLVPSSSQWSIRTGARQRRTGIPRHYLITAQCSSCQESAARLPRLGIAASSFGDAYDSFRSPRRRCLEPIVEPHNAADAPRDPARPVSWERGTPESCARCAICLLAMPRAAGTFARVRDFTPSTEVDIP